MQHLHPIAETYIQNLKSDQDAVVVPSSDQYFLGRLDLSNGVEDQLFEKQTGSQLALAEPIPWHLFPQIPARRVRADGHARSRLSEKEL